MTPEEATITRLRQITAVTARVSTRIYLLKLPQAPTYPAIRVQLISEGDLSHLRGAGGMSRSRIQVDAYAHEQAGGDPYATARDVAKAIYGDGAGSGLAGWRGTLGGSPPAMFVTGIRRVGRDLRYDPEELQLVTVRQDFMVWWRPL